MVDWQTVDTLLLDMDGTLLDLHFDNYFWLQFLPETYAQVHGLAKQQAFSELEQRFAAKRGTLSWYCLDYWSNELQLDIVALKQQVKDKIAVRPFVIEFLQAVRKLGKQTILITNAHRESLHLKMAETGIAPYLDVLASTHDYGLPKEDLGLWAALKQQYPFNPQRSLLIDDGDPILDSGLRYGIGQVLSIRQPDSQQPAKTVSKHPAILHFNEIMPRV